MEMLIMYVTITTSVKQSYTFHGPCCIVGMLYAIVRIPYETRSACHILTRGSDVFAMARYACRYISREYIYI